MSRHRAITRIRSVTAGVLVWTLAACATPQVDALREHPAPVPPSAEIADVPFFSQNTRECGPAALAMVLRFGGLDVTPDDLVEALYTPARQGTLATDMVATTRRHGRLAYPVSDLREMLHEVSLGRPVVVLQNLGLSWAPQWHYAVMIGYDLDDGTVTLHSGTTANLVTDIRTFERTWARGDHWALLVLTPGQTPAKADPMTYLRAAAGLEQAGKPAEARAAYEAGLGLWPDDWPLRMGLGNAYYRLNRLVEAADAFETATRHHDHARIADAFNNLAHVRLKLGDLSGAETAAQRAVAIGGPNSAVYRTTLDAVRDRKTMQEKNNR